MCDLFDRQKVSLTGRRAELAKWLTEYNSIESTHATFWTYYNTANDTARSMFIGLLRELGGLNMHELKLEGMYAKQMQGVCELELSQLFELNVLVNRIETQVDWDKERSHREEPELADVSPEQVYLHSVRMFTDAKIEGKRAFVYDFREYWDQRIILMPSGSVHSQYNGDREVSKQLELPLRSKKGFFSALEHSQQEYWLTRTPEIHSYTSTKYEWGKTRALYGCDVTSHLHADFSLNKCEETFPSYIPTGSRATADYVELIARNLKHMIPFCYDYDDFNSQHSFVNMKAVLSAWKTVYGSEISQAQLESLQWTIDSIDNQFVHDSFGKHEYKTKGTLFSGWRLTSFMNTALNYAYLAAAGIEKRAAYSLHNGDDVYAALRTIGDGIDLIRSAKALKIRAQTTKMNIGTIAEFLRMDFNSKSPTARQYLTRAVATFVHSRIESGTPMAMRSVLESNYTRAEEIIARGGNEEFILGLLKEQCDFSQTIFKSKLDVDKWAKTDLLCGGRLQNGVIGEYAYVDEAITGEGFDDFSMLMPGMRDFTKYIAEQLPTLRSEVSIAQINKTIANSFNVTRTRVAEVKSSKQELQLQKSLQHVWRGAIRIGFFAKARMTVPDIYKALGAVSPLYAKSLMTHNDPYKMISIML
jgi:hypothetical protein